MAMFNNINYLVLVALFLATLTATTISATQEQESIFSCGKHMGPRCGDEVVSTLPSHNKTTVSTECCFRIIQTGYSCFSRLTLFVLETELALRNQNFTLIMAKSDRIFNKCDQITKPENFEFLTKCVVSVGSECGKQVYEALVHDGKNNISLKCCGKLVKTGEACHINMAKALLRTPAMRDVNAFQFLHKSVDIFEQCVNMED